MPRRDRQARVRDGDEHRLGLRGRLTGAFLGKWRSVGQHDVGLAAPILVARAGEAAGAAMQALLALGLAAGSLAAGFLGRLTELFVEAVVLAVLAREHRAREPLAREVEV